MHNVFRDLVDGRKSSWGNKLELALTMAPFTPFPLWSTLVAVMIIDLLLGKKVKTNQALVTSWKCPSSSLLLPTYGILFYFTVQSPCADIAIKFLIFLQSKLLFKKWKAQWIVFITSVHVTAYWQSRVSIQRLLESACQIITFYVWKIFYPKVWPIAESGTATAGSKNTVGQSY